MKIDLTIYKGILYIYDDGKIYEYSTKNLDDVKVIDVKNLQDKKVRIKIIEKKNKTER